MKIAFTGDNHVQFIDDGGIVLKAMLSRCLEDKPDVFCVLGDMGEGMKSIGGQDHRYDILLGTITPTLFVMGNHDLYRNSSKKATPDMALQGNATFLFNKGILMEKSWTDEETIFHRDDCVFVGTLGFCDFLYPGLKDRGWYSDVANCRTIDTDYINLAHWNYWTDRLNNAFYRRLDKAVATDPSHVIVFSHYPHFPTHSQADPSDPVWPYFYNHMLGQNILKVAKDHPEITFWSLAAHSHEYCRGEWGMEAENLYTYGLKTDYYSEDYVCFDTNEDPFGDRSSQITGA